MKKSLLAGLSLPVLALVAGLLANSAHAGGFDALFDITHSPATAIANGSASITVSVYAYDYRCSQPDQYNMYHESLDPGFCAANGYGAASKQGLANTGLNMPITASGGGNVLSVSALHTGSSGLASFTVTSTVAGTKTIQILSPNNDVMATTSVTFTAPVAATPTPTPKSATPKPTATAMPTPVVVAAPSLATITTNNTTLDPTQSITIIQDRPLVLSGTTVANGVVTLTIHSTPRTATVTADKDGHWSYTVTGLEAGNHYVEAAVTDPVTKQASTTAKILSFAVVAPAKVATNTPATVQKKSLALPLGIAAGVVVIALGAGGWYWWRRKQRPGEPASPIAS